MINEQRQEFKSHEEVTSHKLTLKDMVRVIETIVTLKNQAIMMDRKILINPLTKLFKMENISCPVVKLEQQEEGLTPPLLEEKSQAKIILVELQG